VTIAVAAEDVTIAAVVEDVTIAAVVMIAVDVEDGVTEAVAEAGEEEKWEADLAAVEEEVTIV
jgi:hypothetical protein